MMRSTGFVVYTTYPDRTTLWSWHRSLTEAVRATRRYRVWRPYYVHDCAAQPVNVIPLPSSRRGSITVYDSWLEARHRVCVVVPKRLRDGQRFCAEVGGVRRVHRSDFRAFPLLAPLLCLWCGEA